MPEIMSREEFENCNPLNVSTQGVVWQSHLEAQAATIEALAEALKVADRGEHLFLELREKGWLEEQDDE